MDPIRVAFAVTDAALIAAGQSSGKSQEQLSAATVLSAQLANGTNYGHPGEIEFIDNKVDAATGTLTVWGRFPNPDGLLIPGAYVIVASKPAKPERSPLVPVQAVQNDAQGRFVLLVDADKKVAQRRVTVGRQIGQDYIAESGLKGGERVITEGLQKVHPGEVVNATTAANQPSPQQGSQPQAGSPPADGG